MKDISLLSSLVLSLCIETSYADIKWPLYNQQCADDAGPPFVDDEDTFGNGYYHDKTAAFPVLQEDGSCAKPLQKACQDRPTPKVAYLEGPISCNNNGWYCRIMPDENWPPENLIGDLNFGHCNTTKNFKDSGADRDGHCHGSSVDSTYYWWVRDHFFRAYNGKLRCCCGWYQGTSSTPLFSRRIANRCDYRRLVTEAENLEDCRDANEDHGLSFEKGCDASYKPSQNNKPIPEDNDICWEVQRFGYTDQEYNVPTPTPAESPPTDYPAPTTYLPTSTSTTASPIATPTTPPTPSVTGGCYDSSLRIKFRKENDGKNISRYCDWVGKKDVQNRCALADGGVAAACPKTCGSCNTCDDPTSGRNGVRFKFEKDEEYINRTCEWVARASTKFRCILTENICRKTCEAC